MKLGKTHQKCILTESVCLVTEDNTHSLATSLSSVQCRQKTGKSMFFMKERKGAILDQGHKNQLSETGQK